MDGFWSSRCLNYRIEVPDKIGSISSGTTTSMVVKMELKQTFDGFLNVLNVLNMSHGNGSSAFVFQVTGNFKTNYGFYRQRATTFPLTHGRVQLTLWVKF